MVQKSRFPSSSFIKSLKGFSETHPLRGELLRKSGRTKLLSDGVSTSLSGSRVQFRFYRGLISHIGEGRR
jgi:hypothetical protein